ncbi:MAG: HEAT repeat domain-containing protein [Elusimicrobia bacterium]|nr:HEAT repeat domain-containing protein [Elusimicrobiota bacterium]MDE2237350.1 HEAT repeat domain-containing protein [Elusimicrobiota bacterium]MDE2424517.1 HEAT repeat domain-containing protein [Elusimicrobiota bacterium]
MPVFFRLLLAGLAASPAFAAPRQGLEEKLLAVLDSDPSPQNRAEAALGLGQAEMRDSQALDALSRACLADPSREVRRQAALGVLSFDGEVAADAALACLKAERGASVRRDIVAALALSPVHRDDSDVTIALASLLSGDEDASVRQAAARGLGLRGDLRALPALKKAASDPKAAVRRAAKAAAALLSKPRSLARRTGKRIRDQFSAVKGRDRCLGGAGWCECGKGPMHPRPVCMSRADCAHTYANSYRPLGYVCTWDGQRP